MLFLLSNALYSNKTQHNYYEKSFGDKFECNNYKFNCLFGWVFYFQLWITTKIQTFFNVKRYSPELQTVGSISFQSQVSQWSLSQVDIKHTPLTLSSIVNQWTHIDFLLQYSILEKYRTQNDAKVAHSSNTTLDNRKP